MHCKRILIMCFECIAIHILNALRMHCSNALRMHCSHTLIMHCECMENGFTRRRESFQAHRMVRICWAQYVLMGVRCIDMAIGPRTEVTAASVTDSSGNLLSARMATMR